MGESDGDSNQDKSGGSARISEDNNTNSRKYKPGVAIYRPGSGPLRRTTPLGDRSDKVPDSGDWGSVPSNESNSSFKRRTRKPQQPLYVPRPLAERLNRDSLQGSKARSLSQVDLKQEPRRDVRQGSEPRVIPSRHPLDRIGSSNYHRQIRDSRSLEPVAPPSSGGSCSRERLKSGRFPSCEGITETHREINVSTPLVSLCTRERGLSLQSTTTSEPTADEWDGNSLTFIGKCSQDSAKYVPSLLVPNIGTGTTPSASEMNSTVCGTIPIVETSQSVSNQPLASGINTPSRGRFRQLSARGRSRGLLIYVDEIQPGGLRHAYPAPSVAGRNSTMKDSDIPCLSDKENQVSPVPRGKSYSVDEGKSPPFIQAQKSDEDSGNMKSLDWGEEVEKEIMAQANQEESHSLSETKSNSTNGSSREGRRRRRRNRRSRDRSVDGPFETRTSSCDRSSMLSRHGFSGSSDKSSGLHRLKAVHSSSKDESLKGSHKQNSGVKNEDSVSGIGDRHKQKGGRCSRYEHDSWKSHEEHGVVRRGSWTGYCSGQEKCYRSGSNDRYRAGSTDRFYHSEGMVRSSSRPHSRDRYQNSGNRERFRNAETKDRWTHDLYEPEHGRPERFNRNNSNRGERRAQQLYDPMSGTGQRYWGRVSDNFAGTQNFSASVRSTSRDRYRRNSKEYQPAVPSHKPLSGQSMYVDPQEKAAPQGGIFSKNYNPGEGKSIATGSGDQSTQSVSSDTEFCVKDSEGELSVPSEESNRSKSPKVCTDVNSSRSGILILRSDPEDAINTSREYILEGTKKLRQDFSSNVQVQKHLYDPNNPSRPIPVVASGCRAARTESNYGVPAAQPPPFMLQANYYCEISPQWSIPSPAWLDPDDERSQTTNSSQLIYDTDSTVRELIWYINNGSLFRDWSHILSLRSTLEGLLSKFLRTDLRFCARENVEKFFWTVSTHKLIEKLRELMNCDAHHKDEYKRKMIAIIESDTEYLEKLVVELEKMYHFKIETFLVPHVIPTRQMGYVGLALLSVQKIYLFLGDLARYREEVNETSNYGKCRQWYLKAHLINPRNGLPYNQLAVIAVLARRKLDAVYFYMRSLMASNPIFTARENLVLLFDEARRKYEILEKKRKDENPTTDDVKEKESQMGLQREFWIHPQAGVPRLHITTSAVPELLRGIYRQEEELGKLDSIELNKRFCNSYINVHGKLFSKVGMETFHETAVCMLLEFRALMQHKPIPLNVFRFLQLLALNMFSIQNTQLKDNEENPSYRSALQENALIVSLQMFNLILERCNSLLKEQLDSGEQPRYLVPEDMLTLLPAVKIWCDWFLCHTDVWNPPPSCSDFMIGPPEDPWERFSTFVNLLEQLYVPGGLLLESPVEGTDVVRLPEDGKLCDFMPLMCNADSETFYSKDDDMEVAYVALRIRKILFFGTVYLCGVEPPVLKLHHSVDGTSKFVSVVQSPLKDCNLQSASDIRLESFSEDENEDVVNVNPEEAERRASIVREALKHERGETLTLLRRREELQRDLERHKIIVQEVLRNSQVFIEMDVKPRILIPDTNTFIDHLPSLRKILDIHLESEFFYQFAVPLVVFRELEGLSLGGRFSQRELVDKSDHMSFVAEAARDALTFLRSKHPRVRCFTTRGTMISITNFVMNEDTDEFNCNDDRILATALSLITSTSKEPVAEDFPDDAHPRRVFREVVLLTDDRCLRMKAMTKLVPTRDIPDFVKWAGLT